LPLLATNPGDATESKRCTTQTNAGTITEDGQTDRLRGEMRNAVYSSYRDGRIIKTQACDVDQLRIVDDRVIYRRRAKTST